MLRWLRLESGQDARHDQDRHEGAFCGDGKPAVRLL